MRLQRTAIFVGFICLLTLRSSFVALAGDSAILNSPGMSGSGTPQGVGSIAEYLGKDSNEAPASFEALVGIDVFETRASVPADQNVAGIGVLRVEELSPADAAGIRSEGPTPLAGVEQVGVGVLAIGALLAFPPALFGVGLVPKLNFPKAYDVIVAVDAVRTRSIADLEAALRKAHGGETIYLTIIRNGRRRQLKLVAPDGFDSVP